jgi:hypothetical protein
LPQEQSRSAVLAPQALSAPPRAPAAVVPAQRKPSPALLAPAFALPAPPTHSAPCLQSSAGLGAAVLVRQGKFHAPVLACPAAPVRMHLKVQASVSPAPLDSSLQRQDKAPARPVARGLFLLRLEPPRARPAASGSSRSGRVAPLVKRVSRVLATLRRAALVAPFAPWAPLPLELAPRVGPVVSRPTTPHRGRRGASTA